MGGIASNKYTQQTALADNPTSSVKCILAGRAYVKTVSDTTNPIYSTGRLDGTTPTGWTDLGAVMRSKVTMEYSKEYNEVRTGLDGVYYASYVTAKSCSWSFALDQYDSYVLSQITGNARTRVTSSNQVGYRLWVGREDIVLRQVLLVGQNKLDSKEHQYWAQEAELQFAWEEDGDAIVIRVTANLRGKAYSQDTETANTPTQLSFYEVVIWE